MGEQTLAEHEALLYERAGLKVEHSGEMGGSVRGVTGAEQHARIAHVPIGIAGTSGVLRCQVVPGSVPFLIPAYLLRQLGAVIVSGSLYIRYKTLQKGQCTCWALVTYP